MGSYVFEYCCRWWQVSQLVIQNTAPAAALGSCEAKGREIRVQRLCALESPGRLAQPQYWAAPPKLIQKV